MAAVANVQKLSLRVLSFSGGYLLAAAAMVRLFAEPEQAGRGYETSALLFAGFAAFFLVSAGVPSILMAAALDRPFSRRFEAWAKSRFLLPFLAGLAALLMVTLLGFLGLYLRAVWS